MYDCIVCVLNTDDPDFPNHKANHREYLSDAVRFRQIVPIDNAETRRKVHQTFRLQYFKDVVLARFIDDATYGLLHSLILFNQIDIIQYLQQNSDYLNTVFDIFNTDDEKWKIDATYFFAQYCATVKQLQPSARLAPYNALLNHGLFDVFNFALKHETPAIRLAATDILTAIVDNDPTLVRARILRIHNDDPEAPQLLKVLTDLIHQDEDFGLKGQITETLRVMLDPLAGPVTETYCRNSEAVLRQRQEDPEADKFLAYFYDEHVQDLLKPLSSLDDPDSVINLSRRENALFSHLCELVCYFTRMHSFRSKYFVLTSNLSTKIAWLLHSSEKFLQLAALRFFRTCVGLNDEFYTRHLIKFNLFGTILSLMNSTHCKNNLINSACLEFFQYISKARYCADV